MTTSTSDSPLKIQCTFCTGWVTIALDDWRQGVARHVAACPNYPTVSQKPDQPTFFGTAPPKPILTKNDMLEALGSSFRIPEPDPAEEGTYNP